MRKISLFFAMVLVAACCVFGLAGCKKEEAPIDKSSQETTAPQEKTKVTGALKDIVAAVDAEISFQEKVSEVIYKADDDYEMMMLNYGIVDIPAADHLIDYVITTPGNNHETFAVFVFDDEMTQEDFTQVRKVVADEYMSRLASSLQMYMPEEYAVMNWAIENQDSVWRQYDNALALIIHGDEEATAAWDAFEAAALK